MNDQEIITHIIETREDIASIKAMLQPLIPRVESHETRLGTVESDVKVAKRIFGGLFSILLIAWAGAITWLKGLG